MRLEQSEYEEIGLFCDFFDKPNIKIIRSQPDGDNLINLWFCLIMEANICGDNGRLLITEIVPYTPEIIAMISGIPVSTVILGLSLFEALDMIETQNDVIRLKHLETYQLFGPAIGIKEHEITGRFQNDA
jgi:predicted phage replisome organizer